MFFANFLMERNSIICRYLAHFQSPSYVFLYFRKRNFLALILKDFLYFLIFRETKTPKFFFIFQDSQTLSPSSQKKKKKKKKKKKIPSIYIFKKLNFLAVILRNYLYFLKRKPLHISGNRNPKKILYILGNGNP